MKKVMKSCWRPLITIVAAFVLMFTGIGLNLRGTTGVIQDVNAYVPSEGITTKAQATDAANKVTVEIGEEGMTLLKNGLVGGKAALPLAAGAKVSLFGKNTKKPVLGGSGSSGGAGGADATTVPKALTDAGFEVNPALVAFYSNDAASGQCRNFSVTGGGSATYFGLPVDETPEASYDSTLKGTFSDYNDAALIFLSRVGGEAFDLPRTSYSQGAQSGLMRGRSSASEHYLQLDNNEKALIAMVKASGFKKTVLLLNTGTTFELGFVDSQELGVDAVLHVGYPGGKGMTALGTLLKGSKTVGEGQDAKEVAVTPSGRTTDTFSKDFKKDPTWANFGNNLINEGNRYRTSATVTVSATTVAYREGIYLGYRYYETRAFTETDKNWYSETVQYPFGYGLSYSSFDWTVTGSGKALTKDDTISMEVKVKNTGSFYSKDVVQLYYSAPYKDGGIEKAHVVLGAFEKTDLLGPGQDQTVRLSLPAKQMASWDVAQGKYVLEAGTYDIYIGSNAHDAWASASPKKTSFTVAADIVYSESSTGTPYKNQFQEVGTDNIAAYEKAVGSVLSRSDWEGTWPKTFGGSSNISDLIVTSTWIGEIRPSVDVANDASKPWYVTTAPKVGQTPAGGAIMLGDMYGLAKDDPKWEEFLDQLTVAQMVGLTKGGFSMGGMAGNIANLGFFPSECPDGPTGFVAHGSQGPNNGLDGVNTCFYASPHLVACTWNQELAERQGVAIGNEGLTGGYAGLYAPAMNSHRSPFSGRNFEYYSEDPILSGKIGAGVIRGMQSKGCVAFMKHFFLNDQETNRDSPNSIITWANEQTIREVYGETWRIAVEEGGALGAMSAFNRIGTTWAGMHWGALNEVLRKEWGFRGAIVTDWSQDYMNANNMIRGGGDMILSNGNASASDSSAVHLAALRRSAHSISSMTANSMTSIGYQDVDGLNINLVKGSAVDISLKPTRVTMRTGALATLTFTAEVVGSLPSGVAFDAATGKLSGTAPGTVAAGVAKIKVTVTEGTKRMATNEFSVNVVEPPVQTKSAIGGQLTEGPPEEETDPKCNCGTITDINSLGGLFINGGLLVLMVGMFFMVATLIVNKKKTAIARQ